MAEFEYITDRGIIVPDTASTLEQVKTIHRTAWGNDVLLNPEAPLGKVVTTDTLIMDSVARAMAYAANMFNPDLAQGSALDALGSMLSIRRRPATRSIITTVLLGGVPNTVIAPGAEVIDTSGNRWRTTGNRIIGLSGSVSVPVEALEFGSIECAIGALNRIAPESVVTGWETVVNTTDAQPGEEQETAASFRRRRRQLLAINSQGSLAAMISAVYDIPSVRSLKARENTKSATQVVDGITMVPHSIWFCVDGGSDSDVALAIMSKKDPGCDFNGALTVPVQDPISGQIYPVQFDRPTAANVWAIVTVAPTSLDAENICRDAIMMYSDGELDGELGFEVGTSVSPFELSGAINQIEPRITVKKIELSSDGTTYAPVELPMSLDELPIIIRSRITVISA